MLYDRFLFQFPSAYSPLISQHFFFFTLKRSDSQKSRASYFHNDIKAFNFSRS